MADRQPARHIPAHETPRTNRVVTPHAPLGPSDLPSRALADVAPAHFDGQRVTVMTRQGGAGAAGMQYMATGRIPFAPEDLMSRPSTLPHNRDRYQ